MIVGFFESESPIRVLIKFLMGSSIGALSGSSIPSGHRSTAFSSASHRMIERCLLLAELLVKPVASHPLSRSNSRSRRAAAYFDLSGVRLSIPPIFFRKSASPSSSRKPKASAKAA